MHCGSALAADDPGFVLEGDLFHGVCLNRVLTDETVDMSRALGERSRRLIQASRRQTRSNPDVNAR